MNTNRNKLAITIGSIAASALLLAAAPTGTSAALWKPPMPCVAVRPGAFFVAVGFCPGTTGGINWHEIAATLDEVGGVKPPPEVAVEVPVVEVTLDDFSITMADTLPAGAVRIEATNVGAEDHEVSFARVIDGATVADVAAADQQSDSAADALLDFYGGTTEVRPGATETVEVDLPAGTYLVLDLIPSSDGTPHVDLGMVNVVTVGDAAGTSAASNPMAAAELPVDDVEATIELFEYGFAISDGFDGDGRVLVTNSGEQTHDLSIFRIGESGSYDELLFTVSGGAWVDPTLYLGYGGVSMIDPGVEVVVELHLEPGEYAIACFVPDAGDGRQHLEHGMIQPLTIAG